MALHYLPEQAPPPANQNRERERREKRDREREGEKRERGGRVIERELECAERSV